MKSQVLMWAKNTRWWEQSCPLWYLVCGIQPLTQPVWELDSCRYHHLWLPNIKTFISKCYMFQSNTTYLAWCYAVVVHGFIESLNHHVASKPGLFD